jgi:outer membrane protein insertion porin family
MSRNTTVTFVARLFVATAVMAVWAVPASAQVVPCAAGETSTNLPPAGSAPLYRCAEVKFHAGNDWVTEVDPMIDPQTYGSQLTLAFSQRSQNRWMPYDETVILNDFWKLWRTEFLEDLRIEVVDEPYENGVVGKHVIFRMEERARVKVVDYIPADATQKLQVDVSKIESTLRERELAVRLDSFVDESSLRKVIGVIRELYAEKGYNDAVVTTERANVAGGAKLLHLTFKIESGPKVEVAEVLFDGNQAFNDGKLRRQMKDNKPNGFLGFLGDATFQQAKFADDAERVSEFYKNNGYAGAQVGQPRVEVIRTSEDGRRRWIRLRVPVDEGQKFTIGKFELTGEDPKLNLEAIKGLFKIQEGDAYSNEKIRKGLEKAKEAYGAYGFWQWEYDPELRPRGIDPATGQPIGEGPPPPIMDITIKMNEGKQFLVNRITFTGNTNTHDAVIRREMRVLEGGIFNAEALKESVRRLNQLGYFKALEGKEGETEVTQTPGTDDKVDVRLKFEEQNRNQLAFGAGVSQYDGFFGQLSFQTSNFLGRGETVGISLQKGSQARQYQLSFSEPYLFERPITVGADLYSREYIFPFQYTQRSTGTNYVFGFPLANYTRAFMSYSYEQVEVKDINPVYLTPEVLSASPYLADSLLLAQGGKRTVSKVSPSVIFNTVNQPIFPSAGTRYTVSMDFAGLGGNTEYTQARAEGIWYVPLTLRTSLGLRAEGQYIRPYGTTTNLPIFEKLFTGGEYSIRGYDLRTVGPRDPVSGVLTGGNKMLTFNAEYYVNLFGQVRVLAFYDAGQVQDIGQRFRWKENITQLVTPPTPFLSDVYGTPNLLTEVGAIRTEIIGRTSAFKTSTGAEVRFMMPVLNVPFRLIAAYNPQRRGVLDNQLQPTKRFTFRFAVGTTF